MRRRLLIKLFAVLLLVAGSSNAQVHSLSADHPVYNYLFLKSSQGYIPEYAPHILPLTTSQILVYLDSLLLREKRTIGHENKLTTEYIRYIRSFSDPHISLKEGEEWNFYEYSSINEASALYSYHDSIIRFDADLAGDFSLAFQQQDNAKPGNSFLMGYGAKFKFQYSDWLAASLMLQNGNSYGDRDAALSEARIRNSHTFTVTGRNNFDFSRGYFRIANEHLSLSAGREKLLIGASIINRTISGEEKPDYDCIRFETRYKSVSYSFLHSWLTTGLAEISLSGKTVEKYKPNKYFAMNRLEWRMFDNFSIGLTQMMIYAYRSPELAYLTPFLFWESAQRSMNDPDNGLLAFDFTYDPISGVRLTAEILADDINFDTFGSEGFNSLQNTTLFRTALFFPELLPLSNALAGFEITAVRPFTFSHPGYKDALNFTNNGVLMGDKIEPNSVNYSLFFSWQPSYAYVFGIKADYTLQGNNTYAADGTLLYNFGGDFSESYNYFTPRVHKLLAGERLTKGAVAVDFSYRFSYHILLTARFRYEHSVFKGITNETANTLISFVYTPFGELY